MANMWLHRVSGRSCFSRRGIRKCLRGGVKHVIAPNGLDIAIQELKAAQTDSNEMICKSIDAQTETNLQIVETQKEMLVLLGSMLNKN